jgi:glycosyltransferase involved in cell wall biosynthesis
VLDKRFSMWTSVAWVCRHRTHKIVGLRCYRAVAFLPSICGMSAQLQLPIAAAPAPPLVRRAGRVARGRVLLVSPQPFYEDRGTPIAVELVSRSLASSGFEVDLLAFPIGREVAIPGVTIHRCARLFGVRSVPIGFSAGKVALDVALFHRFKTMLSERHYDVVHAVEEAAYFAAMLCPSRRVPFIYDMASAIPVELERHPLLGTRLAQRALRSAEQAVLSRASHVLCSQGLAGRVRSISPETPVTEWRFPVPDKQVDSAAGARLRAQLGIDPKDHIVVYAGNFSRYQGLDLLVDAFVIASRRNPRLTLACVGAADENDAAQWRDRLPADVRPHAHVRPRVPREQVPDYLAMADTLVSLRPEGDNAPLKLFEYMAAGRPIVATRGAAHEPVLNSERAFLCDARADDIADQLTQLAAMPARAARVAEAAKRFVRAEYSADGFKRLLHKVYEAFEPVQLPWDARPALLGPGPD